MIKIIYCPSSIIVVIIIIVREHTSKLEVNDELNEQTN